MNWRGLIALGWIVGLLSILAGFAWLTQNPEAEIVEKARSWPLVGSWAKKFRQAYVPPQVSPSATSSTDTSSTEVVVIEVPPEEALTTSFVWVRPGAELHEEPDKQSPIVETVTAIRNMSVLEQRENWYRVSFHASPWDRFQAWVWLENYQDPSPEVLNQPDPVLPLPATPPNRQTISLARELMEDGGVQRNCGPYSIYSDAQDKGIVDLCPRVAQEVEEAYRRRYGVEPVSPPAEAILLFRQAVAYREFREMMEVSFGINAAHASPAKGYMALYEGDRSMSAILGTLVHELTHLLNRRALGPGLPPWLSEGVADDLAESKMDADGSLHPGRLGGASQIEGQRITRWGGVAAAIELQSLLKDDDLPTLAQLFDMGQDQFYDPQTIRLHYALSSFWIRYLLSGFNDDFQQGFRAFLQDLAKGETDHWGATSGKSRHRMAGPGSRVSYLDAPAIPAAPRRGAGRIILETLLHATPAGRPNSARASIWALLF